MNAVDLIAVSPLIALSAGAIITLLTLAVRRSYIATCLLTGLTLIAAAALIWPAASVAPRHVTDLLVIDINALFYIGLLVVAALGILALSERYFRNFPQAEEFYVLMLAATLGASVLAASNSLVSFFLGLEVLSIPLYAMIAYVKTRTSSIEAAVKYLILAGASSALLAAGIALIYAEHGSLLWSAVLGARPISPWTSAGMGLVLTALAFKLALPPLHLWTADVYQGAALPATTYIATVSKGAILILTLRYLPPMLDVSGIRTALAVFAALAMTTGNLLALRQNNVKRLLGYSSIAHMGYVVVAILAGGSLVQPIVAFYLVVYMAATISAFGVLTALSDADEESQHIRQLRGLAAGRPGLAAAMLVAMLSLAGIPVTGGFFGKIYIVLAGAEAKLWWLLIVLIANSVIGLYYYLRIIAAALSAGPRPIRALAATPPFVAAALSITTLLLVVLGIAPGIFWRYLVSILH